MSEGFERQRGNQYYDFDFSFPIGLDRVERIQGGENLLRPITKCGDKIIVNRIGYVACHDIYSREIIWTLETPGQSCQDAVYNNELYILASKAWLARCDSASGSASWKVNICGEIESIKLVSDKLLLTNALIGDRDILNVRSKSDGTILWSYEGDWYGYLGSMLCENGILLVVSESGLHAFDEDTGQLLWKSSFEEWQKEYFPDIELTTRGGPYLLLMANGVFYLGFSQGILAAVDARTAEPRWFHRVQRPKFIDPSSQLVLPFTALARGREVIFTISQAFGRINYLTIVNIDNGELVYQSDRNITPEGCRGPIVLKQHLVGGAGRYLMVFDLDKKEFVWEFEHPTKLDLFSSALVPFEGGLVIGHPETNSLYWFGR